MMFSFKIGTRSVPRRDRPEAPQPPEQAELATSAQIDLDRALLPTEIRPWLAWAMIAGFAAAIGAFPARQLYLEATGRHRPQAGELFTRSPTRENLHRYEEDLARNSAARQAVQPQVQAVMTGLAGFGNSRVLVGRDGWLFYRAGVGLVSDRGLLDPTRLRQREKKFAAAGDPPGADPRPAILAFHEACRAAGARLVVVPIPDKAAVHPGELTSRLSALPAVAGNADHAEFLRELREAGVDVFDPTPASPASAGDPKFLRQDTHWNPAWMGRVAEDLASHLRGPAPPPVTTPFRVEAASARRVGDLVDMLELPKDQALFGPEEVALQRVIDTRTGAAWQPSPSADVLLLGDSFTNIFSAGEMGWGEGAGFGPQLARFLRRDVDVVALNGSGATGTRRELARRGGLAGKKVVVWEFAARELMEGNWEVVHMPAAPPAGSSPSAEDGKLVLVGTVAAVSKVPPPFAVPYADCLTFTKVRVDRIIEGKYADNEIIAVMWGMKANELLPAASYAPGRKLKLRLVPMRDAPVEMKSVRRVDDLGDFEHRPFLVVEELDP